MKYSLIRNKFRTDCQRVPFLLYLFSVFSALDPALPIYEHKNLSERLHMDDAEFVQVIHTCGSFISFEDSLGHVDFYPNGGKFPQPSCVQPRTGTNFYLKVKTLYSSLLDISIEERRGGGKCGKWFYKPSRNTFKFHNRNSINISLKVKMFSIVSKNSVFCVLYHYAAHLSDVYSRIDEISLSLTFFLVHVAQH